MIEGRCKATWKAKFKLPWREAGLPNHRGARQALAFFTKVGFQRQLPRLVPPALRKTGIAVCALHSHMETLGNYRLGSMKLTTLKDLYN